MVRSSTRSSKSPEKTQRATRGGNVVDQEPAEHEVEEQQPDTMEFEELQGLAAAAIATAGGLCLYTEFSLTNNLIKS